MNLLPSPSPGRRYFTLGLVIILLWLVHFTGFSYWLYTQQEEIENRLSAETKVLRGQQLEAKQAVQEHQTFMNEHGPHLDYQDAVDGLREDRLMWQDSLSQVYDALPAGVSLVRTEAEGARLDGWAVSPSAAKATEFLEALKDEDQVEKVFLRCLGRQCEGAPLSEDLDKGAQVLHFYLVLRQPSVTGDGMEPDEAGRGEGGGNDDP